MAWPALHLGWVLGVNLWGVIHGIRAFLPALINQGEGHIVNTASIAGLNPGSGPVYAASKHAVVAISEELFKTTKWIGVPVGVSVLCPGWVRTAINDADRNWPERLGDRPPRAPANEVVRPYFQRATDEGMEPAALADLVADAVVSDRFWILPRPEWVELAVRRWHSIAEGENPDTELEVAWIPADSAMDERDSVGTDGAGRLGRVVTAHVFSHTHAQLEGSDRRRRLSWVAGRRGGSGAEAQKDVAGSGELQVGDDLGVEPSLQNATVTSTLLAIRCV